ncbi:MAG: phosphoribosyl-AMP cyclohydrolase [Coprococcus sp.]|nr:phosphoribosyl-AMP cyclohydrolase [Coprococcus sp.]
MCNKHNNKDMASNSLYKSEKMDIMENGQTDTSAECMFESTIPFDDFKLNSDGLIPCVTQDCETGDVLMVAYMNKESYEKTLLTGRMTYWSRSRNELWTKGDTSGHYQFVRSLSIDCDKDTILAKVSQIGAACHTGNRTCFFTSLIKEN